MAATGPVPRRASHHWALRPLPRWCRGGSVSVHRPSGATCRRRVATQPSDGSTPSAEEWQFFSRKETVMRIMGVDPGGTTGVVVIEVSNDESRYTPDPSTHIMDDQIEARWGPNDNSVARRLSEIIIGYEPDLIVIEQFTITQRTVRHTRQPDALWIIGGVRFLADIAGIPVHLQPSSLAKTTWDADRLKDSGWAAVVKRKHARDALRHALTACVTWKPSKN